VTQEIFAALADPSIPQSKANKITWQLNFS
jgi:hypothetical protein